MSSKTKMVSRVCFWITSLQQPSSTLDCGGSVLDIVYEVGVVGTNRSRPRSVLYAVRRCVHVWEDGRSSAPIGR